MCVSCKLEIILYVACVSVQYTFLQMPFYQYCLARSKKPVWAYFLSRDITGKV